MKTTKKRRGRPPESDRSKVMSSYLPQVRVSMALRRRMERAAHKSGFSVSEFVRCAVEHMLGDL